MSGSETPPVTAQVRLGHADVRTTLGIYAKATTELAKRFIQTPRIRRMWDDQAVVLSCDALRPPDQRLSSREGGIRTPTSASRNRLGRTVLDRCGPKWLVRPGATTTTNSDGPLWTTGSRGQNAGTFRLDHVSVAGKRGQAASSIERLSASNAEVSRWTGLSSDAR